MAYTTVPQAGDLAAYLIGLGLIDITQAATLPLSVFCESASAAWEERTGWHPFVRDSVDVARRFDPPGPNNPRGGIWSARGGRAVLDLRAGLLSVTSIVTGYSATSTNPQAGTVQLAEDDYWLLPEEAPLSGHPYTEIEFATSRWGGPRSIRILGKWGYTANITGHVWQTLLESAALMAMSGIVGQNAGGLIEWTEEAHERYGENPFGHFEKRWRMSVEQAVQLYQRRVL